MTAPNEEKKKREKKEEALRAMTAPNEEEKKAPSGIKRHHRQESPTLWLRRDVIKPM